jgi:hypothetical protein
VDKPICFAAGGRRFDPGWLHLRFTCKSAFYAVHGAFRKPAAQGWASRLGIKRLSARLFSEHRPFASVRAAESVA